MMQKSQYDLLSSIGARIIGNTRIGNGLHNLRIEMAGTNISLETMRQLSDGFDTKYVTAEAMLNYGEGGYSMVLYVSIEEASI